LHLQKAYASLNYNQGDFPIAEKVAAEILSLPMFPQLSESQQAHVLAGIQTFIARPAKQMEPEPAAIV